jgi:3-oxoacyl-[acyl-carrier-protein] synthase-3
MSKSSKLSKPLVRIEAIEYCLPAQVVSNTLLKRQYPSWDFTRLEERTGVFSRPIAQPQETALDFAEIATRRLLERGDIAREEIGAIIFCTETPDHPIPPNACILHGRLELPTTVMAFDIDLGCSGFVYGLGLAQGLIAGRVVAGKVLLINGDTYSRLIYPGDRATRVLFGDGSAVTVVAPAHGNAGVLDLHMATGGRYFRRFIVPAGGSRQPLSEATARVTKDRSGNERTPAHIEMDGLGVLTYFNRVIPPSVTELLARSSLTPADIKLFVFHQASRVALESISRILNLPPDKVVIDLEETGNLVSASIPVTLRRALDRKQVGPGDLVLLCGFGVGLSWGSVLVRL